MKINNKEFPTKFGLNQSILYCELRGINITQMNEEFAGFVNGEHTGGEIRDLIWSSLKDGARVAKVDFPYTNLDVGDWMEDISAEEMTSFIEEMAGDLPKAKANSKKKVVQKK